MQFLQAAARIIEEIRRPNAQQAPAKLLQDDMPNPVPIPGGWGGVIGGAVTLNPGHEPARRVRVDDA